MYSEILFSEDQQILTAQEELEEQPRPAALFKCLLALRPQCGQKQWTFRQVPFDFLLFSGEKLWFPACQDVENQASII